jgi:hypothetical protein
MSAAAAAAAALRKEGISKMSRFSILREDAPDK